MHDYEYPLSEKRIKLKKRFKRGVDIDGGIYFLPSDNYVIFSRVFDVLKIMYDTSDDELKYVISKYYSIWLSWKIKPYHFF